MKRRIGIPIAVLVALIAVLASRPTALHLGGGVRSDRPPRPVVPAAPAAETGRGGPAAQSHSDVGFASPALLDQHWRKHGREFGGITSEEYLRRARALRDALAGGTVLEATRSDGVITRFDRASGAFIAFDRDLTIRTYFRPNDGENYFRRQLSRPHGEP